MADFTFDDAKTFSDNVNALLDHSKSDDAAMAAILKSHIAALTEASGEFRSAAAKFNDAVRPDLDALASKDEGPADA